MRHRSVVAAIVAVALGGCFATHPPGDVGFANPHALQELDGSYQNLGEGKAGEPPTILSAIIWPRDTTLSHESIQTISVRAIGDTVLAVRARSGDRVVVKEAVFVAGEDFQFKRGRLRLRAIMENTLHNPEAGGLFVARTTRELGLDKKGQGKLKKRETVVGAAYLVVPIALSMSTEVRFLRLGEP